MWWALLSSCTCGGKGRFLPRTLLASASCCAQFWARQTTYNNLQPSVTHASLDPPSVAQTQREENLRQSWPHPPPASSGAAWIGVWVPMGLRPSWRLSRRMGDRETGGGGNGGWEVQSAVGVECRQQVPPCRMGRWGLILLWVIMPVGWVLAGAESQLPRDTSIPGRQNPLAPLPSGQGVWVRGSWGLPRTSVACSPLSQTRRWLWVRAMTARARNQHWWSQYLLCAVTGMHTERFLHVTALSSSSTP